MKKGLLIVLSGPSGVGKGTVRQYFMDDASLHLAYSVSMTTRKQREGEVHGKDYLFVSEEEFQKQIDQGNLLEYAQFVGNYYGTPWSVCEQMRNEGKNVVLEIEVQGMIQIKEKCQEAITIFIVPPSMEELERRIRGRRSEEEDIIRKRLEKAENEMRLQSEYKYVVCNDTPQHAAEQITKIIKKHIALNEEQNGCGYKLPAGKEE